MATEQELVIHAAYGSSKDISVYSALGLKSDQMFIIGKPSKRQSSLQVSWISNGYAEHLAYLTSPGGSRPAQGNARMVIPKGTALGMPPGLQRRRTFKVMQKVGCSFLKLDRYYKFVIVPGGLEDNIVSIWSTY